MPEIDEKTAKGISVLSRLDLTLGLPPEKEGEELQKLTEEFSKIVGYMDILAEVDTSGVEPLYSPMIDPQPPREDIPRTEDSQEQRSEWILDDAPMTFGRFFAVPRIV
jgi:aspartyl-tRNA(Asn)/glutamyl-tRNA(Gln) amidotransferase subunit C